MSVNLGGCVCSGWLSLCQLYMYVGVPVGFCLCMDVSVTVGVRQANCG